MKFHLLASEGTQYIINAYTHDSVTINDMVYHENLIVMTTQLQQWSARSFDSLCVEDFEALCALKPELILLGTGSRLRFPKPALLLPCIEAHLSVEVMDMRAACRTYNILMGEGRDVAAALLFD
ncbi:MAG: Mth938-like domain-containing protein [Thiotrichaceae bacterium]|nr:Mth938-like domain-containing protein [Thiotrichaceae bacterium]